MKSIQNVISIARIISNVESDYIGIGISATLEDGTLVRTEVKLSMAEFGMVLTGHVLFDQDVKVGINFGEVRDSKSNGSSA